MGFSRSRKLSKNTNLGGSTKNLFFLSQMKMYQKTQKRVFRLIPRSVYRGTIPKTFGHIFNNFGEMSPGIQSLNIVTLSVSSEQSFQKKRLILPFKVGFKQSELKKI